jgi:ABC-type multidrug transport system ATPase subunit
MKLPNDPADFEAGDGTLLEPNAPRSGARTEAIDGSPVLGGTTDQTALVVNELTKRFGERTAFSDVSFQVAYGEVFGFLGPNGAGKTTTVRTLGTLIAATSGAATVAGIPLNAENGADIRKRISMMPESPGLYWRLTVTENLEYFGRSLRSATGRRADQGRVGGR